MNGHIHTYILTYMAYAQRETGYIKIEDILRGFAANRTRDVIARQKTAQQAQRELAKFFSDQDMENVRGLQGKEASFDKFVEYCDALSGSISDDGYFALQLTNMWGSL